LLSRQACRTWSTPDVDYQVPIKGFSLYNDQTGKVTSTPMYGYALGPEPQVPS